MMLTFAPPPCVRSVLSQAKLTDRYAKTEKDHTMIREALRALAAIGRMGEEEFAQKLVAAWDDTGDLVDKRMANLVKHDIVLRVGNHVEFQSRAARRFAAIMPTADRRRTPEALPPPAVGDNRR